MAKEGNIPLGDIGGENVASPMEHEAPKEVLPINSDAKNNIPHFQFTSF